VDVSDRLAPRYARYGLLANLTLAMIDQLRASEGIAPSGDDVMRLRRIRELLAASWQGAVVSGEVQGQSNLAWEPISSGNESTRGKLDDTTIVKRMVPANYSLENFLPEADSVLHDLSEGGLTGVSNRDFLDGPFTDFLEQLARSNRGTAPATRRAGRQRVSLA
jgi:hypothetical protein